MKLPTPPRRLSREARRWWSDVVREFDLRSAGELAVLTEAAASLDRLAECRRLLKRDGLVVNGARGLVAHPAARLEQQHRQLVLQACRQLGISNPLKG